LVCQFLDWIEGKNGNSVSTRNNRLAAIRSFIKYSMTKKPEYIRIYREVLDVHSKKADVKPPVYLSISELQCILSKPDIKTSQGIRDLALLSLLYDSGARVQELVDLTWQGLRMETPATVLLVGKGRKSRIIPLMPDTAKIISSYRKTLNIINIADTVFTNKLGRKLTRSGVEYIIEKYAAIAGEEKASIKEKRITPHVYRHSKGMHLTQADVNIIYIRDLLGHSSVQVTERYARADSRTKREALEKASKNILPDSTYTAEQEEELMQFLKNLT
jgi:site-specific recombinase XerD